jgi:hypothetical protein
MISKLANERRGDEHSKKKKEKNKNKIQNPRQGVTN